MANESNIPAAGKEPQKPAHVPGKHHVNGLLIGGCGIALLFLIFLISGGYTIGGVISPLWIGFAIGILVAGLGLFRLIKGPLAFGLGDTEHKHTEN